MWTHSEPHLLLHTNVRNTLTSPLLYIQCEWSAGGYILFEPPVWGSVFNEVSLPTKAVRHTLV